MKELILMILFIITENAQAVPLGAGTGSSDSIEAKDVTECEILSNDDEKTLISQALERAIESTGSATQVFFETSLTAICL